MRDSDDLQRGIERVADQMIREAMEGGAFANLPGEGRPLPDIDDPYTDDWWVRSWMKRERLRSSELTRDAEVPPPADPRAAEE